MTDLSKVPPGDERARGTWQKRLRSAAYLAALLWLSFSVWATISDYQGYLEDRETYHRVYLKPELHETLNAIFGVLSAIALAFHLGGWKDMRFSRIVIGFLVFEVCWGIVGTFIDIDPICCT